MIEHSQEALKRLSVKNLLQKKDSEQPGLPGLHKTPLYIFHTNPPPSISSTLGAVTLFFF